MSRRMARYGEHRKPRGKTGLHNSSAAIGSGLRMGFFVLLFLAFLCAAILYHTPFGNHLLALGGTRPAQNLKAFR